MPLPVSCDHALQQSGLITPAHVEAAEAARHAEMAATGYAATTLAYLVTHAQIDETDLLAWLSAHFQIDSTDLRRFAPDQKLAEWLQGRVDAETAFRHRVIPLGRESNILEVGMVNPRDTSAIEEIAFLSRWQVRPRVVSDAALTEALLRLYGTNPLTAAAVATADPDVPSPAGRPREINVSAFYANLEDIDVVEDPVEVMTVQASADEAPVIRVVNGILSNAVTRGASDVHVEPGERDFQVRFRIDGELQLVEKVPVTLRAAVTSRLKIMAGLDIAERRLPQDGRMKLKVAKERRVDFRVSTLPGQWGEKVVLRLLDQGAVELNLEKFGFAPRDLGVVLHAIQQPHGMILVTGPTGSGKTTTLYATLARLNQPGVNVVTVEDPVEYNLAGITQVHVRSDIGLTFASALRSILRQDPNILMVGEIRDRETADTAIQAAQTGHLVLSTLHTNSAPETITRLLDMGVPGYAVAASVRLVISQRLVRRVCPICVRMAPPTEEMATALRLSDTECTVPVAHAAGQTGHHRCHACHGSGYQGRAAVFEVLPVTRGVRQHILGGIPDTDVLRHIAATDGMRTLRQDGLRRAQAGETTLEQVLRETATDEGH